MMPDPVTSFIDKLIELLKRGLEERISYLLEHGWTLEEIGPAERLVERMLDVAFRKLEASGEP
jgi:hypothetical protein